MRFHPALLRFSVRLRRVALAGVLLGLPAGSATARASAPPAPQESYLGTLVQTNLGPRLIRFGSGFLQLRIARYTTPEETQELVDLIAKKGPDELRSVLGGRQVGSVQIGSRLAQPIAAAWKTATEAGEHLVVVVPRNITMREIFGNRLSADYPYTVIELDLGPDRHGKGSLSATARLKAGKDGGLVYEDLRPLPLQILGVRPLEP